MLAWIVLTDGRKEFLEQSIPSFQNNLIGDFSYKIILDDSGDRNYRAWLKDRFPEFDLYISAEPKRGYTKAMRRFWHVVKETKADYVFHQEDDFLLKQQINCNDLISVLEANPHLTQMALRRQAWFENEIRDGGMLETLVKNGAKFEAKNKDGFTWLEQRTFWTCNPNIHPTWVEQKVEWPATKWSEYNFSRAIYKKDRSYRGGIWGRWRAKPNLEHIGAYRKGSGY